MVEGELGPSSLHVEDTDLPDAVGVWCVSEGAGKCGRRTQQPGSS